MSLGMIIIMATAGFPQLPLERVTVVNYIPYIIVLIPGYLAVVEWGGGGCW